jgi:hypothetical protein
MSVEEQGKVQVPPELLISFFQEAKERLGDYVYDPTSNDDNNNHNGYIPIPLKEHQGSILNEQLIALNKVVDGYNNTRTNSTTAEEVTVQNVQDSLRLLGSIANNADNNTDNNADNDTESMSTNEKLKKAMKEMNDTARMAFCKSILASEYFWYQQQKKLQEQQEQEQQHGQQEQEDDNSGNAEMAMMIDYNKVKRNLYSNNGDGSHHGMVRQTILEFCGLCTTAIKIPQVITYIQTGKMSFFNDDKIVDNDSEANNDNNDVNDKKDTNVDSTTSPQQRISHLQQMILCALDYEPSYGAQEIQKRMVLAMNTSSNGDDDANKELKEAFATFSFTIQETTKEAMNINLKQHSTTLSDKKEGGVTRVVAVNYSEREIRNDGHLSSGNGEAPLNQRMEEQDEETQREQLQMAQKAAQLQKSILDELLGMHEEQRKVCLLDAKNAHEGFLKEAMALPASDRVVFMQNISTELQKKLLMYKLWESQRK